jgi:hypothetical protein
MDHHVNTPSDVRVVTLLMMSVWVVAVFVLVCMIML